MHVIDQSVLLTTRELAHAYNTTAMSISRWIRRGCPVVRTSPYLFDLIEVEAWRRSAKTDENA
jgi:hypothetical protein